MKFYEGPSSAYWDPPDYEEPTDADMDEATRMWLREHNGTSPDYNSTEFESLLDRVMDARLEAEAQVDAEARAEAYWTSRD